MKTTKFWRLVVTASVLSLMTADLASADSYDRRIILINQSDSTIAEFHASNVGTNSWQEDILGDSVVPPGSSVPINLDDGSGYCLFDFKTVTRDGATIIRRGINVCNTTTYTITD